MSPGALADIRLADAIEAQAARDLYAAAPAAMGLAAPEVGGATLLLAPSLPVNWFNRAIGLGVDRPATEADLDAILAIYRSAGVADFWVHLSPAADPPELADWLAERGLALHERRTWAKFLRGPEAPPPCPTLPVRPGGPADAETAATVACNAFGLPPALADWFAAPVGRPGWDLLVAETAGRIVATGSLFRNGATAWLGIAATLPEHRGRDAQSALLAERIRTAAAACCNCLATETGEPIANEPDPSLANVRRLGFGQVCSRLNYAMRS
jgi:GNAT superfamily N-acetyltransferase